jgi:hypothetical protein
MSCSKIIYSLLILAILSSTFCKQEGLKFLAEVKQDNNEFQFPVNDTLRFVNGFAQGLGLFKNLTHQAECFTEATDPEIVSNVVGIINTFKNLNWHSDFANIIKEVSEKAVVLIAKIGEAQSSCARYVSDINGRAKDIITFVKDPSYLQKVSEHGMLNIGGFIERAQNGINGIKDGNFYAAGFAFGDVINFGLFWNFNKAKLH